MQPLSSKLDAVNPVSGQRFRPFFLLAALYDGLLGVGFFLFYRPIFAALGTEPPEPSYIHLTAAFIAVQGLGYFLVARAPRRNVDLVRVGAVYKFAYIAVALLSVTSGNLPHNVFLWFAGFDVLFLAGFVRFLWLTGPAPIATDTSSRAQ